MFLFFLSVWKPWDSSKCCYTCTMTIKESWMNKKKNALAKPIWRGYADKGTENEVGSRTAGSNEFKAVFIMLEQCGLKWIKLLWFHFFSLFLVSAYDGVIFPGGILFFSVFVLASGGPSLGRTLPFTALVPGDGEGKKGHICVEHRVLIFICFPVCFITTIQWKK